MTDRLQSLAAQIIAGPRKGHRRLVAIAGAPASGKSTLAEQLVTQLTKMGCSSKVVPMDGFHLDNRILAKRGMQARKGAPETFDARGFAGMIKSLHGSDEVFIPIFDRSRDIAIACADVVASDCDTVVIEGNYLLLDEPLWRDLRAEWDVAIMLKVPFAVLRDRLVARWLGYGLSPDEAEKRAGGNDLPNAERVIAAVTSYDIEY